MLNILINEDNSDFLSCMNDLINGLFWDNIINILNILEY